MLMWLFCCVRVFKMLKLIHNANNILWFLSILYHMKPWFTASLHQSGLSVSKSCFKALTFSVSRAVSCYSLFPLLYEGREYPVKVMLLLTHVAILWSGLSQHFSTISTCEGGKDKKRSSVSSQGTGLFTWPIKIYLSGLLVIETWGQFVHPYILGDKMPFLPLMLLSIYCAIGMLYSWIFQLGRIIRCS